MALTYFKRFRMEIDLASAAYAPPLLAPGYRFLPWESKLLAGHAEAKYHSFRSEVDANVFPCLGDIDGCHRLMHEIVHKEGFLPSATWLLAYDDGERAPSYCGTIQGICDRTGVGAVQNLGITPEHRGRGLGSSLLFKALEGFERAGLRRAFLEVTSQNEGAIRLYRRIGFRKVRTVYKAIELDYVPAR